jgi:hypothetical protein
MAAPQMPRAGPGPAEADRARPNWVLASLLAGIAMAGLLMLVATLLRKGFLTPLYLVAAPFTGPDEATTSMAAADAGDPLFYAPGAVTLGVLVHLTCSLLFGAVFASLVTRLPVAGPGVVAAGVLYALTVMLGMSFALLPLAADVLGGDAVVADMAARLGWATWIVAHVVYGLVLGRLSMPQTGRLEVDRDRLVT